MERIKDNLFYSNTSCWDGPLTEEKTVSIITNQFYCLPSESLESVLCAIVATLLRSKKARRLSAIVVVIECRMLAATKLRRSPENFL